MSTLHASLIDYRFRMLPTSGGQMRKGGDPKDGAEGLIQHMQKISDEEDQTFMQNGIIVEHKYDMSEDERKGRKMKHYVKKFQASWIPANITEYLFYDDTGHLAINEEQVKSLYIEFTSILRNVYKSINQKYEEVIKTIIMDTDLNNIEFPLICEQLKVASFATLLPAELQSKLNLKDFDLVEGIGAEDAEEVPQKEEELKESEKLERDAE